MLMGLRGLVVAMAYGLTCPCSGVVRIRHIDDEVGLEHSDQRELGPSKEARKEQTWGPRSRLGALL
jgi:hypothetical protein